jgi:hypothetical protein
MQRQWPRQLAVRSLTDADARAIARWRYSWPWRLDNLRAAGTCLSAAGGYEAVVDAASDQLVGFCCSGDDARLPDLAVSPEMIDVGLAMAPRWVGSGHGLRFCQTVIDHYLSLYPNSGLRVVAESRNECSHRVAWGLGFLEVARQACQRSGQQVEYRVMILPVMESALI